MAHKHLKVWDWVSLMLLIFGGILLGILGIFDINLLYVLFGMGWVSRVMFSIIGIGSLYSVWSIYQLGKK